MNLFKKKNNYKDIEFKAWSKYSWDTVLQPVPASQYLPKWWKSATPFVKTDDNPTGTKLSINNRIVNANFKKCTPMLDSLLSGYIIPLWSDVLIEQTSEGPIVKWRVQQDVFEMHGSSSWDVERPHGFHHFVYKYMSYWTARTPPGYSALFTSPFGYRGSNPFKIVDAVLDTDSTRHQLIFPCWLEQGFEGIVERGTPMVQVIPFKRDDWKASYGYYETDEYMAIMDRELKSTIVSSYIKNGHHSKKTYK